MKNASSSDVTDSPSVPITPKVVLPTEIPFGSICFPDKGRMHRRAVPLEMEASVHHVMSRTVGGVVMFSAEEKEAFRLLMWRMAKFCGVEVLTYCVMGNHFHLLVRVPPREQFLKRFEGEDGEERFFTHLKGLYSKAYLKAFREEIAGLRRDKREHDVAAVFARFTRRFCDLSLFVKELKERYSRWYNKKHSRRGTLWMARFKSVLVESGGAMATVAAYIDLNPVRAGLVNQPEDYRWCGYAEALGGSKRVRRGLCRAVGWPIDHWEASDKGRPSGAEVYRDRLYESGMEDERRGTAKPRGGKRYAIALEKVRDVVESGGKLTSGELLGHRLSWLSEGVALGSEEFVARAFGDQKPTSQLRELPFEPASDSPPWFCLSRWLRKGIG